MSKAADTETFLTYYELRAPTRREAIIDVLREVKREIPSEVLKAIPEIGILTIDDFLEWLPYYSSYPISKLKTDMRSWLDIRYCQREAFRQWMRRRELLLRTK